MMLTSHSFNKTLGYTIANRIQNVLCITLQLQRTPF